MSRIQQKHPVIYRIGYSLLALWTQTMYENIVVFCCPYVLKQKQFSDERFWKQTLLR